MHSMCIIHFLNLAIQLTFFFKLVRLNAWKKATTAIIFSCFFFNYFFLKNCGYEMFLTDAFASTVFLVSFYFLQCQKYKLAISISFLGILTWPTVTYVIWLLYFFKDAFPQQAPRLKIHTGKTLAITFPLVSIGAVATLYLLHNQPLLESMLYIPPSIPLLFTSAIAWCLFLFVILRHCDNQFYTPNTYIREFIRQSPWEKLAFIIIPFITLYIFLRAHTNNEFIFSGTAFILQIFLRPLKYPFITPVAHISYFGLTPLLVIFLFRHLSEEIFSRSAGYALAFLAFLFFAIDSEARHILPLLPLVLVPLANVLDKMDLTVKSIAILVVLQLALSHFYIPINTDGLAEAFESNNFNTVAQRYFMSFGPWMRFHTYIVWAAISAFTAILVSRILKKSKI